MEERYIEDNDSAEDENTEELSITDQETSEQSEETEETEETDRSDIQDLNDKYLRLYAEFENYKKRVNTEKEELIKYGNESLLYELLPAIDNLELALKHASNDSDTGIVQGVEITLKELHRTLEKFGLSKIDAAGKHFDPSIHHAMMKVEREDMDEKLVAEELRAGYIYCDKVLRPSLVAVSVKPQKEQKEVKTQEEETESENAENSINKNIEEES